MTGRGQPHYTGSYAARARAVRDAAYADPSTRCWRCGKTLTEAQRMWPGKRVTWHAGHTVDGNSSLPLAPEHSVCNIRSGGSLGAKQRLMRPSRKWF
jgi:hypothetical protein